MDELAHLAGADPVDFRLDTPAGPAADRGDRRPPRRWRTGSTRPAASKIGTGRYLTGRGIAAMRLRGQPRLQRRSSSTVTVDTKTGKVTVDHVWSAQDCGPAINPDGMKQQAEGCLMQGISRALIEELKWEPERHHLTRLGHLPGDPLQRRCRSSTSRSSTAPTSPRSAPARC